jgi:hypothetical protein
MLATVKFHIVPAVNVDGAVLVEENWKSDHKILNKPIHFMDDVWFSISVEAKKFIL